MFLDKRVIYIILAVMVFYGLYGYLSNPGNILELLLTIPGVLVAITFHEFAHAFAADKLGDDTPRLQGRLNLNPLSHLDPIGSIMLLFARFGWGKPVQVNPRNYDRRMSMDKADAIVSIAGPTMNFILAISFTLIYCILLKIIGKVVIMSSTVWTIIIIIIDRTIITNIGLGIFNLIPLPPLDGSKVIKPFLSYNIKTWFETNEEIFQMIFAVLWILGFLSPIISPAINVIYNGILNLGLKIFGLV